MGRLANLPKLKNKNKYQRSKKEPPSPSSEKPHKSTLACLGKRENHLSQPILRFRCHEVARIVSSRAESSVRGGCAQRGKEPQAYTEKASAFSCIGKNHRARAACGRRQRGLAMKHWGPLETGSSAERTLCCPWRNKVGAQPEPGQ